MARTPTKVKPSTKPAAAKKAAPAKTAAKTKPTTAKAKAAPKAAPKSEVTLLAVETFAKFTGYVNETKPEDQVYEKGDTVYILDVTPAEGDNPTTYTVLGAELVALYIEDPENEDLEASVLVVQEIQALAGRALADAREKFLPIPSVGKLDELVEQHGGDLVVAAQAMYSEIEESFFYLGGLLAKARREGVYLTENGGQYEGETAWNDFCEQEFSFSGAKGGDLARLYTTFAEIPDFDPSKLADIGWSKLREIQRFVTEDNYDELLDEARTNTKTELKVKLVEKFASNDNKTPAGKSATRGGGAASIKTLTLTFKLPEESHSAVQLALKEAVKKYGVSTDAEALERIIVAWAEEHVDSVTKSKSIASKVAKAHKATAAAKKPVKAAA